MHYLMIFNNNGTLDSDDAIENNIYDLGAANNFFQVFGKDPKFWFLPVFYIKRRWIFFSYY